jgi:hypothetical protein
MQTHDGKESLTREESETSRIIKETSDRLEKLNNDLGRVLSGKGPEPIYPGYGPNRPMDYKTREKHRIEAEIRSVQEKADRDLDELMQQSPPDIQLKVHKQIDEWKNPEKSLSERGAEEKDLGQSQDYAARILAEQKEKSSPTGPEKTEPKETIAPPLINNPEPQAESSRFFQSLSYTMNIDYTDKELEKEDRSIEIDLDDY